MIRSPQLKRLIISHHGKRVPPNKPSEFLCINRDFSKYLAIEFHFRSTQLIYSEKQKNVELGKPESVSQERMKIDFPQFLDKIFTHVFLEKHKSKLSNILSKQTGT